MDRIAVLRAAHVVGAVLLLGNVTVTGFWAAFLYRRRADISFGTVARAILWADLVFTLVGGAMLTISGILLTMARGYRVFDTPWLLHGIVALGVATVVWLTVLLPDQWRLERAAVGGGQGLRRTFLRWSVVGWASTLLLFYGLWTMVTQSAIHPGPS